MQNLFDKASLVMVPSGYDNGKLYNIKPEDKSSAFEFERATMATRVNSSGLVETMFPEATNLLLQSNQFDTSPWVNHGNAYDLTYGQLGYDGTNDAWLIDKNTTNSHYFNQPISTSGVQTLSFHLKSGTANSVLIFLGSPYLNVNIEEGTFGTERSLISKSINDLGNGWKRVSMTFNSSLTVMQFQITNNNILGVTGSIYVQDVQLEAGYFATPYIETTTQAVTRQNQANQPRIDYTSGEGALLLEPQRTNLVTYSEDINAAATVVNSTVTVNEATSPDNSNSANKYAASTNFPNIRIAVSVSNTLKYTFSCFVKYDGYRYQYIRFNTGFDSASKVWFDLVNGVVTTEESGINSSSIEDYGNGWYRITATSTATSTDVNGQIRLSMTDTDNSETIVGSTSLFNYIWGAQLEQGNYATSYIPTNGQQETRAYEFCRNHDAADLIGQTEGTLFLDLNVTTMDPNSFLFGVYGGSPTANEIYFRNTTSNRFIFVHYYGGTQAQIITNTISEGRHKLAACYKNNDWALYLDGELVGTDTSGSFAGGMFRVTFGYYSSSVYQAFESVNNAIVFKTRLTDEELKRLTSLSADATTFTELANNNGYTIL